MNVYQIPLAPAKPQRLQTTLGGKRYTIQLRWNDPLQVWVMCINDDSGNPLVNGITVVSGVDLVNQFNYLGFSGALIAQSSVDVTASPSYNGLGTTDGIFYIPYGQVT